MGVPITFLKKHNPDVVGITGYISHVNIIKDYAKQVKDFDSKIKVVVGEAKEQLKEEREVALKYQKLRDENKIKPLGKGRSAKWGKISLSNI